MTDEKVRNELGLADIILPSIDGYDEASFTKINRPIKTISYQETISGLINFSKEYQKEIWLEIMLLKGLNDHQEAIEGYQKLLSLVRYNKLYLNTPVRPPAEAGVFPVNHEQMIDIASKLGGIPIDYLAKSVFHSDNQDEYEAILSLIRRHPMNQHEIKFFLESREYSEVELIFKRLERNSTVQIVDYMGYRTYRLK
jgi:wyosine [tRNA(Phe)-imidazoG37] synthetase (radical SAM superfamily)